LFLEVLKARQCRPSGNALPTGGNGFVLRDDEKKGAINLLGVLNLPSTSKAEASPR
jgi:hypothetical protein